MSHPAFDASPSSDVRAGCPVIEKKETYGMELRAQEQRLVEIKRRATLLAVALVSEPFSATTDERLRAYVSDDAGDAQDLAQELCALPEEVLRERISELLSRRTRGGGVGERASDVRIADTVRSVAEAGDRPVWLVDVHGERADVVRGAVGGQEVAG
ncbi:hypothetical protein ACFYUM_35370 [Streptomyces fimicarius]|uniref:hypothetical protein n=1 Tax=Streptomyces griseus TaxID=1911 RepID=UPI0036CE1B7C